MTIAMVVYTWRKEKQLERFRSNLQPGQLVRYFKVYYSRTEDNADYGTGVIEAIDRYDVITILRADSLKRLNVERKEIYPADY